MSIESTLKKNKFNETANGVWHTKDLSHEAVIVDDRMSIISLSKDKGINKILYKGQINKEAEKAINKI
jgi:hypothetical protein